MTRDLHERLVVLSPGTFVITAPTESEDFRSDINGIVAGACLMEPKAKPNPGVHEIRASP